METLPMISVIIPAYNAETTIRRACASVLSQSYGNVELIVVNDGSKDGTQEILDQIAVDHNNVLAIHQPNGGVCRARNNGLQNAKGEYVFFLDSDDEVMPGCLEQFYQIARKTGCGIVAGPCIDVKPDGTEVSNRYHSEETELLWWGKEGVRQSLLDNPATYSVWGKLYGRDVLEGFTSRMAMSAWPSRIT